MAAVFHMKTFEVFHAQDEQGVDWLYDIERESDEDTACDDDQAYCLLILDQYGINFPSTKKIVWYGTGYSQEFNIPEDTMPLDLPIKVRFLRQKLVDSDLDDELDMFIPSNKRVPKRLKPLE